MRRASRSQPSRPAVMAPQKTRWFFPELDPYSCRQLSASVKKGIAQTISYAAATLLLRSLFAIAASAEPAHDGVEFFEKRIRPIFVEYCYKCHSQATQKIKGGL